jgi:hypothetical protein
LGCFRNSGLRICDLCARRFRVCLKSVGIPMKSRYLLLMATLGIGLFYGGQLVLAFAIAMGNDLEYAKENKGADASLDFSNVSSASGPRIWESGFARTT